MFCALKGATRKPRRAKMRHSAVTSRLLPAEELVPWTINVRAVIDMLHLQPAPARFAARPRRTRSPATEVGSPNLLVGASADRRIAPDNQRTGTRSTRSSWECRGVL